MGRKQRTPTQIEHDRKEIARMYLFEHKSAATIAKALGMTVAMVYYDLGVNKKKWMAEKNRTISEHVSDELDRLAQLEEIYTEQWAKSHEKREIITRYVEARTDPETGESHPVQTRQTHRVEPAGFGEKQWLDGLHKVQEQRAKLLGLDQISIDITTKGKALDGAADSRRVAAIMALYDAVRKRHPGGADHGGDGLDSPPRPTDISDVDRGG